jgi:hypothetical protein
MAIVVLESISDSNKLIISHKNNDLLSIWKSPIKKVRKYCLNDAFRCSFASEQSLILMRTNRCKQLIIK